MAMPKFKATKWQLHTCKTCYPKFNHVRASIWYQCNQKDHKIISRPNVPFRVPDMCIEEIKGKWISLKSKKMNQSFEMHYSKFGKIILGLGVEKGGSLPNNQWWMYDNAYGCLGIKWIGPDV